MPFAVAAAGVSAVAGIAGGLMQKGAIDKGRSDANAAIQQGIQTATNQLRRDLDRRAREQAGVPTCWG